MTFAVPPANLRPSDVSPGRIRAARLKGSSMSLLVAVTGWQPDMWLDHFGRSARGLTVVDARAPYDPAEVRYAAVWKPKPGLLAGLVHLEAIFNLGAGVDALIADATLPAVPVVRVVDPDLTRRMTEYVVWQVLHHHRAGFHFHSAQSERRWRPLADQPAAGDVRIGIMGLGVLGRDAASALRRLGFDVAGWSRRGDAASDVPVFAGAAGLDAFLARTDILVVLLPLTPETRGILNAGLFARLARDGRLGGPVLINAGRGGLQVETDIIAALADGTLLGASLDVFEAEPLSSDSPLWAAPNVVITPHAAADSDPRRLCGYVLDQIERHRAGLALDNVVDRMTGY
ncbi:MAG: glyoxylate/hydroxypyruvate reductase A [Ancalomicrobiaceae bacterium]|nr:glyoxylate/hydroxypyruvate reductase A [Ancalomicrobiaceae bacterium]